MSNPVATLFRIPELKQKILANPKYKDLALAPILDFAAGAAFPPPAPAGTPKKP